MSVRDLVAEGRELLAQEPEVEEGFKHWVAGALAAGALAHSMPAHAGGHDDAMARLSAARQAHTTHVQKAEPKKAITKKVASKSDDEPKLIKHNVPGGYEAHTPGTARKSSAQISKELDDLWKEGEAQNAKK